MPLCEGRRKRPPLSSCQVTPLSRLRQTNPSSELFCFCWAMTFPLWTYNAPLRDSKVIIVSWCWVLSRFYLCHKSLSCLDINPCMPELFNYAIQQLHSTTSHDTVFLYSVLMINSCTGICQLSIVSIIQQSNIIVLHQWSSNHRANIEARRD